MDGSSPQSINIEFESKTAEPVLGTTVDSWRTHPAFIWDDETLPGIWVGKFETTGDATNPTILPNVNSLTEQSRYKKFVTSLIFGNGTQSGSSISFAGNSKYGLTEDIDTHIMKNSEWGAVAYLSHSYYGINGEVRINNYFNYDTYEYMTGCGASVEDGIESEICEIVYGSATSYPQSTTGNISGVFDMSGGAAEAVMGNYNNVIGFSDFSESTFPDAKYYDKYTSTSVLTACNGGNCYGHALSETAEWYGDYVAMVINELSWVSRGDEGNAGVFNFNRDRGYAVDGDAWRSVLFIR